LNWGGGLFGDLNLEGRDDAQMDDLGVTDQILSAQMEILAEIEILDSGEDTMGEDSEDEDSFFGRETHNPVAPDLKAGSRVVYIGQEGDEMHLGYVVSVHGYSKGGPPFYTAYLEGLGEKQVEGQRISLFLLKRNPPPLCPFHSHPTLLPGSLNPRNKKMKRRNTSSRFLNWKRSSHSSAWITRNLRNCYQTLIESHSNCP
jgi:hypothetical protein